MRRQIRIPLVLGLFVAGSAVLLCNFEAFSTRLTIGRYWLAQGLPITMIVASVVIEWIFGRDPERHARGFHIFRKGKDNGQPQDDERA